MRRLSFAFLLLFTMSRIFGQKTDKVYLSHDDTTSNRYLAILPAKLPLKGFLFLVPSFGETPEGVLQQTDLPVLAAEQGILTIIPTFKTGLYSLGIDSLTQESFKEIVKDAESRYKLKGLKFYIGGFSMGGTCVVKFAEEAVKNNFRNKPIAIFVVDAPLDFERFYNSAQRIIRIAPDSRIYKEDVYMSVRIREEMKGTPENALLNYHKKSPYSYSDTNQTAIKYLIKTPVRYYTEPDIAWLMKEFKLDYSGLNAVDGSCMINELNLLGNHQAVLITTQNKGYRRPDNRRQPHSWSIVDSPELITWLLGLK